MKRYMITFITTVIFIIAFTSISIASSESEAKIYITGDLMCQYKQQIEGKPYGFFDFNHTFKYAKEIFKDGDLVIGNLETMISSSNKLSLEVNKVEGKPYLNSPNEFLDAVKNAGYNVLVNANNHNCDTNYNGIIETLDQIDKKNLLHTGLFKDGKEKRYIIKDVNGIRIGILSYATYYNQKEDNMSLFQRLFMLNRYSKIKISSDIKKMKANGVDFIIAYNHWGSEYTNIENSKQIKYAMEMAEAGVDFIAGSHPHALQKYDILQTKDNRKVPVIYSLGNFVSHMTKSPITKDTIILKITLSKDKGRVSIKEEGYYPCTMYEKFGNYSYVLVPCCSEFNGNYHDDELNDTHKRISQIIGDKIDIL